MVRAHYLPGCASPYAPERLGRCDAFVGTHGAHALHHGQPSCGLERPV